MGVGLAARALQVPVEKVGLYASRILVGMALRARDQGTRKVPAGVYFGGHSGLALYLGEWPDDTTLRRIRRNIRVLEAGGYLVREQDGRRGSTARYRLVLPGPPDPVDGPVDDTS
jgi:hypothetical protein